MAELSAETQAIIQRLKDEGELVRNRGTNSIRSVKIEMSKFQGVFDVISANVIQQTSILRQQAGFAAEALEQQKSKEQFEELQKETEKRNDDGVDDARRDRELDDKIDKIGDSIASAFTLKNLALGGAGIFFGYNLLKGFVDQQYNGAWSEMEGGIASLGPKLREFANFDLEAIKLQFDQLVTDIGGMRTSLASMTTSLQTIADVFQRISEISWGDVASVAFAALSSFGVAASALRLKLTNMRLQLVNGTRTVNGQTWWQRALGIGKSVDAPNGAGGVRFNPDGTVKGDAQSARPGPRPAPTPGTPVTPRAPTGGPPGTPVTPPAPTGGGRGSYGTTREGRAQMRAGIAASLPNQYRVDSKGRLQNTTGGVVSDAEAERILQETLRNMPPKYAKAFNLIKALVTKVAAPVFTVWMAIEIAFILADENMTDEQKMQALAPILGAAIGSLGGAAIGAAIGSIPPATGWGTLLLGIAGGIAGALAGEQLGYYVAKWAFSEEPTEEERRAMVTEREALAASTNEFAGFMDSPEYNGTPATPPQPSTPQTVPPRPRSNGGRNNLQGRWDRQYGATHNADGTPIIRGGGRGSIVEGAGERAAYQSMIDSLVESEGVAQRRLDEVSAAGAVAPVMVINAPTTVSPVVNNVSGGRSVNQVSIRGGGGGGVFSVFGLGNPYGLPHIVN